MPRPPQQAPKERGQALVEFALTLPIFLMLVFGIMDLARVMFAYTQVVDASRQAIRYGIVEGLSAPYNQYFDCAGIRDAALNLPGIITLDPTVVIKYHYKQEIREVDPATNEYLYRYVDATTNCSGSLTPEFFAYKYNAGTMPMVVLEVEVTANVQPITPVLMPLANSFAINYSSSRTIVFEGADYTYTWLIQPDKPRNFRATAECGLCPLDGNYEKCYKGQLPNVSFSWNALSPIPDRIDIFEVGDTTPVKTLETWGDAFCNSCAGIPRSDSSVLFYMVAYVGEEPLVLASPPSNTATATCPKLPMPTGPGTISGFVWNDTDGNGSFNEPKQQGINGVQVELRHWGRNETMDDFDDYVVVGTTAKINGNDGAYVFSALEAANYRITVVPGQPALDGKTPTTPTTAGSGGTSTNVNFGYR